MVVGDLRVIPFNDSKLRRRSDSGGPDGSAAMHNRSIDALRRSDIVSVGPGLRLEGRPNGKHLRLTRFPGDLNVGFAASTNPFEIFVYPIGTDTGEGWTGWRNVRVHRGLVNNTHPDNDAETASPIDILVPASSTLYKVFLDVSFTATPACITQANGLTISGNTITHGAAWWSGHPGEFPTAGKFYMEIGEITTGVDSTATEPPGDDPEYRSITINQIASADRLVNMPNVMLCTTTNDGGAAGSASTTCSYTYTATDLCGNIVLAAATPDQKRIDNVKYETATGTGLLYLNASGQYVLMNATGERPIDPTAC